ncbi:MAG: T9SS type A sorting domain-containing protein [Candidatus Fermentibacteraceae bacterium]|nr:T9SS type A sorting domain-containing protein [Candidatus Fermentibacteraceae bacterium]
MIREADLVDTWHYMYPEMPATTSSSCMRLNAAGNPMICYRRATGSESGLHYTEFDGSSWNDVTVDQGDYNGYACSMELSPEGYPVIIYGDFSQDDFRHAWYDGSEWHKEVFWAEAGNGMDMAVDTLGNLHVAFTDDDENDVFYGFRDASGWTFENIGHATTWPVAIALDGDGNPHVIWENSLQMIHQWLDGGTWYSESYYMGYPESLSMAFGPYGVLHVVMNGSDLMHFWRSSSGWHTETVDTMGGIPCDMAVGADNSVHIAYQEELNADLRYAGQTGSGWYIEVISWEGFCGLSTSIVLDDSCNPHILHSRSCWGEIIWWGPETQGIGEGQELPASRTSLHVSANPVRTSAIVYLNIQQTGDYTVSVYDICGRLRQTVMDGHLTAGEHTVVFDPASLPEGTYYLRLAGQGVSCSKAAVILR